MTRLEVLLAELYTDHGIDLIRTTAGMSKEVEEKITELAEELVKLLQGRRLPLKNVKEVNAILDEAAKAIKAQYTEIAAAHDANLRQLAVIEGGFASSSVNSLVSRPIMLGVGRTDSALWLLIRSSRARLPSNGGSSRLRMCRSGSLVWCAMAS